MLKPVVILLSFLFCHFSFADLTPVESFAKLPQFADPVISPDGKHVAALVSYKGKSLLVVKPLVRFKDPKQNKLVPISAGDALYHDYTWGNNEKLIVRLRYTEEYRKEKLTGVRMFLINKDGSDPSYFKMKRNKYGWYKLDPHVINQLQNDEKFVLASVDNNVDKYPWYSTVHKVDLSTGRKIIAERNKIGARYFWSDESGHVGAALRLKQRSRKLYSELLYKADQDARWDVLQSVDYFDPERLIPLRYSEENNNHLIVTQSNGYDEEDILLQGDKLLIYDLTQAKVLGEYVDQDRADALAAVEAVVGDATLMLESVDADKESFIVKKISDTQPPQYYHYRKSTNKVSLLARSYPQLEGVTLAQMRKVSYQARDGLTIPAFLTLPVGSEEKNLPLVVYPHGGPWAHDVWGFDNYVQFLASRGYAVLQPQFRGSTGYGFAHEAAGYKQWGLGIQDDITDGVHWLISEGIVDKNRVCIFGASFGGYAAAVGLAKTPDLYKCGISTNGVLDLKRFFSSLNRRLFNRVEDVVSNEDEDIEANSPFHNIDNIKAPLLLIGSENDSRVPVEHSRKMHEEMKKRGKSVEYVELAGGEHWRTIEAHEIKKMQAIEAFLEEHL